MTSKQKRHRKAVKRLVIMYKLNWPAGLDAMTIDNILVAKTDFINYVNELTNYSQHLAIKTHAYPAGTTHPAAGGGDGTFDGWDGCQPGTSAADYDGTPLGIAGIGFHNYLKGEVLGRASEIEISLNDEKLSTNKLKYIKEKEVNKTIEYKGCIYEIGKCYAFAGKGSNSPVIAILDEIIEGDEFPFRGHYPLPKDTVGSNRISELSNYEAGTVTAKPIELVDGQAYRFDFNGVTRNGIYREYLQSMIYTPNSTLLVSRCTNIVKLTPEGE